MLRLLRTLRVRRGGPRRQARTLAETNRAQSNRQTQRYRATECVGCLCCRSPGPKLLELLRDALRSRHYSRRTSVRKVATWLAQELLDDKLLGHAVGGVEVAYPGVSAGLEVDDEVVRPPFWSLLGPSDEVHGEWLYGSVH